MINFNNFQKSYHDRLVLKIDRTTLNEGVYWVKGSNGSGKSTLLKSLAGFFSFKGEIHLNGLSLKKDGVAYRRLVNFADAEPIFPEFLTGTEMIGLFAEAKGAPKEQEKSLVCEMNMEAYINSPVGSYSSGMLKKLSLVLGFLGTPKVILLDEPLITIDSESANILYRWIRQKYEHEQISFILSSHQEIDKIQLPQAREIIIANRTLQY